VNPGGNQMTEKVKQLEDLANSKDLQRLETLLAEFNIFEALGLVRQELRHSDFLAFLLNPRQNHRLGDVFQREWYRIDILVVDEARQFVCAIENKIDTPEHSDQLARYRQVVAREYPACRPVFVYLTPDGAEPSDEAYTPLSYTDVVRTVEAVAQSHAAALEPDVCVLLAHWIKMLRRHIVADSEISQLARKIYREHQQAMDLIFEHRPDLQTELAEVVKTLIAEAKPHGIVLSDSSKSYIRFSLEEWIIHEVLLVFEFQNVPGDLSLRLYIYSDVPRRLQQTISNFASEHPKVFRGVRRKGSSVRRIYNHRFLTERDFAEADLEELEAKTKAEWEKFLAHDLPAIRETLKKLSLSRLGGGLFRRR
jgi:hypothetical protein